MKVHLKSKNEFHPGKMSNIFPLLGAENIYNEVMNEIITWYQQIIHVCRAKLNQVSKSRNNDI